MTNTDSTDDDKYSSGTYQCPYPGCGWEASRPIDSDVGLTQAVVTRELEKHREEHANTERCPSCDTIAEDAGERFPEYAVCTNEDCWRSYFFRRVQTDTDRGGVER